MTGIKFDSLSVSGVVMALFLYSVIGSLKVVFNFEAFARLHQPLFIVIRLDILQAGRMHFVNGDVNV
ncbi:hypothetical protein XFF6166_150039 [Xanthomonas citri pv. fuscans]|nr:hypothetical protein XFF6166_150039 [Xanthomonas citri pv. fuscans]